MKPNEQSKFCTPAGFVPKKSRMLWFVIKLTILNKYVEWPVHAFPSSDQIVQSLKLNTTYMACICFQTYGYFIAAGKCMNRAVNLIINAVKSMTNQSFLLFLGTNPAGVQNFDCSFGFILLITPCDSNLPTKPLA